MSLGLFDVFSKLIDETPVKGIISAVEREHELLENDLATNRPVSKEEVQSVLAFCRFLEAVRSGRPVTPEVLPETDTSFYWKITARLIAGGQLPESARDRFDEAFTVPLLKSYAESV